MYQPKFLPNLLSQIYFYFYLFPQFVIPYFRDCGFAEFTFIFIRIYSWIHPHIYILIWNYICIHCQKDSHDKCRVKRDTPLDHNSTSISWMLFSQAYTLPPEKLSHISNIVSHTLDTKHTSYNKFLHLYFFFFFYFVYVCMNKLPIFLLRTFLYCWDQILSGTSRTFFAIKWFYR